MVRGQQRQPLAPATLQKLDEATKSDLTRWGPTSSRRRLLTPFLSSDSVHAFPAPPFRLRGSGPPHWTAASWLPTHLSMGPVTLRLFLLSTLLGAMASCAPRAAPPTTPAPKTEQPRDEEPEELECFQNPRLVHQPRYRALCEPKLSAQFVRLKTYPKTPPI